MSEYDLHDLLTVETTAIDLLFEPANVLDVVFESVHEITYMVFEATEIGVVFESAEATPDVF